jgi:hypothetical protein
VWFKNRLAWDSKESSDPESAVKLNIESAPITRTLCRPMQRPSLTMSTFWNHALITTQEMRDCF